jgi:hypothetical protein
MKPPRSDLTVLVDCRNPVLECQCGKLTAPSVEETSVPITRPICSPNQETVCFPQMIAFLFGERTRAAGINASIRANGPTTITGRVQPWRIRNRPAFAG